MLKNSYIKSFFVLLGLLFIIMAPQLSFSARKGQGVTYSDQDLSKYVTGLADASNDLIRKGEECLKNGSTNKAITLFWQAHEMAPFNPEPFIYLINVYLRLNQRETVFKLLEKATSVNTDVDYILNKFITFDNVLKSDGPDKSPSIYIPPFKGDKKAAVTFCFDDGAQSVYDIALPLFDKFGFKVTIPVNPGVTNDVVEYPWWGSWEQWRDADKRGHEIANHSMSHGLLVGASEVRLETEINNSYDLIKKKVGRPPFSFIFPGDEADNKSIKTAREKHLALRNHDFLSKVYKDVFIPVYGGSTFTASTANNLVDFAIKRKIWLIAECHAIKTEKVKKTFKPLTEDLLRQHLIYIKKREKEVWVDTLKSIYLYLYVRRSSELVVEHEDERNIEFKVKKRNNFTGPLIPLTVVINIPKNKIFDVNARLKDKKSPVNFEVQKGKILLDITPGMPVVHVSWDYK